MEEKTTRMTEQKMAILAVLRNFRPIHPTSGMVLAKVRKKLPKVSLGTVYRNLNALRQEGYIEEMPIIEQPSRFDARVDEHSHFFCENCGEVRDLEDREGILRNVKKMIEKKGFTPKRSTVMFSGLCQKCKKLKKYSKYGEILCSAHGKTAKEHLKKTATCVICDFQKECLYHAN